MYAGYPSARSLSSLSAFPSAALSNISTASSLVTRSSMYLDVKRILLGFLGYILLDHYNRKSMRETIF